MANENVKTKRNTFLQAFSKLIIGICGIAVIPSALLSALSPYVNPSTFVWTAFFGLGFWVIFFINLIIFLILLLLKARRTLLIPIFTLLILIPGFLKSYSFGEEKEGESQVKVMTYNIGVFRDYKMKSNSVNVVKNKLVELVKKYNPDVLCLQESGKWPENKAKEFSKMIGYKYYSFNPTNGNSYFSKYPIENPKEYNDGKIDNFIDIKKIKIDNKISFYLINCHLNSFMISPEEIEYINDTKNIVKDSEVYGKSLISKLSKGFKLRIKSTENLLNNLPEDSIPYVICGDFNDTPLSYTYNQISKTGLHDAFITSSSGIGKTYCGPLPLLRIDYFWYNDKIEVVDYERIKQTTSDHYPLIMTFNIKNEVEDEQ